MEENTSYHFPSVDLLVSKEVSPPVISFSRLLIESLYPAVFKNISASLCHL